MSDQPEQAKNISLRDTMEARLKANPPGTKPRKHPWPNFSEVKPHEPFFSVAIHEKHTTLGTVDALLAEAGVRESERLQAVGAKVVEFAAAGKKIDHVEIGDHVMVVDMLAPNYRLLTDRYEPSHAYTVELDDGQRRVAVLSGARIEKSEEQKREEERELEAERRAYEKDDDDDDDKGGSVE